MREYKKQYLMAEKAGKSKEDLWAILEERMKRDTRLNEEMTRVETSYLFEIAYRLKSPHPTMAI